MCSQLMSEYYTGKDLQKTLIAFFAENSDFEFLISSGSEFQSLAALLEKLSFSAVVLAS